MKYNVSELTLEEKASLCSGYDFWHLKGIERLNMPSIMVADGPHGLRKQDTKSDHVGLNKSVKATCFPTASGTAASWNKELLFKMGEALGEACLSEGVSVLLGPGVNIKRHPMCGRNFEYFSEDPYLTGHLASAMISGVQSKGIGTSIKHFAVNSQEYRRMATDSVVDERTLREIYLPGFEIPIKEASPWTVMCAYNKIDGIYCSDNKRLLTDILVDEWGYKGLVVSDWGACNDRVEGIKAGMALEMPSSNGLNDQRIIEAVLNGDLLEEDLDKIVTIVLELIEKASSQEKTVCDDHHALAKKVALESAVLLKNENVLPLTNEEEILFIGEFFEKPRYQGSGSSLINPKNLVSAKEALDALGYSYNYASGYNISTDKPQCLLISEAVSQAKLHKKVVIFAGLTDDYESEGFDRTHLEMPASHNKLIEAVTEVNDQVIVVLQNGAPITMPWKNKVKGILEAYLGGEAGGEAVIDLLYGIENPSGKLAETFPLSLDNILSNDYFGMGPHSVEYREQVYVGYRDYDTFKKDVLYPFGYGLCYTEFEYSDLEIDKDTMSVSFNVKNIGSRSGAEIAQLYVRDKISTIHRPNKELKGFDKVYLEPNESKKIVIQLDDRAFSYYDVDSGDWVIEEGDFEILIGASSRDIRLSETIYLEGDISTSLHSFDMTDETFKKLIGRPYKENKPIEKGEYDINSTLGDIKETMVGKILYKEAMKMFLKQAKEKDVSKEMLSFAKAMVNDLPLRAMVLLSRGRLNFKKADAMLDMMNGHMLKGIKKFR